MTLGVGPLALATTDAPEDSNQAGIDGDRSVASKQDESVLEGRLDVTDANTTFRGEATNDTFGAALANVGDLNGDGVADVAVGAPENDTGGIDAGAVYVFYGPVNESDLNASQANVTVYGNQSFAKAGESIAGADVDGDSVTELVVGAPGDNDAAVSAGAVYVLAAGVDFAANASDDRAPANVSLANASTKLLGEGANDHAGAAVAGVGNHTDDEPDRVLVGAPRNDTAGTNAGAAYLVTAVESGTASLGDATTFFGEGARDQAGHAVSTAGDFDGDGAHDVLVGAYRNDSTDENAGAAYLLSSNGTFDDEQSLATADVKLVGASFRDGAGYAVSNAGDVDDDGYDDVVVGAPFNDTNGNQAGVAYVVTGGPDVEGTIALNASALVLYGEAEGDRAGWAVSAAGSGDVTCDAYADVLVGAPGHDVAVETLWNESEADALGNASVIENAGTAYIVAGDESLDGARNLSDSQAAIRGAGEDDQVGWTVTDLGNATDDRTADVLVGAPFVDANGNDSGAAYLFDGQCVAPEPEPEPTTTTTPTTTEPAEPPVVRAESRDCEELTLKNPSSNEQKVRFYVTPEGGTERGPFTLAPGEHGTFTDVPPGEYTVRVETKRGGEAVLASNGESSDTVRVEDCPRPEPEPKGSIRDVDCEDVSIAVRDVAEQEVTVQVRFADGSTTREVVETDADGDFRGDVAFDNRRGKTVTGVRLFAGAGVDGEELDRVSNLEVVCREPAPEPSGVIRDVTCDDVSLSVSDVVERQVTVIVRFDDGSSTRRIVGVGADGEFSGDVRFANPRDKNVSAVFLFAGRGSDGEELDRVTRLDVTCREPEPEPEPEPAGSIRDVDCDAVSVLASNVDADEVTVQVRFEDGSTTTASGDLEGGEFDGEIAFDNPDDENVTRVRLLAGSGTSGERLDDTGRIDVQCREPEPEPAGSIREVDCDGVSVLASNVDADEVTIEVRFEDGSTTTASAELDDGEFDGIVSFENPRDRNVTRVRLFAGSETSGERLDDTGRIDVQCREPEPEPAGSIRNVACDNVSVLASNVDADEVTVQVGFEDGSTTTASADLDDGEFDGLVEFENPEDKNVTRVRLLAGSGTSGEILDDTGRIDVTCREPEPEPAGSILEVSCDSARVQASNVDADNLTVIATYVGGTTTGGTVELDDGEFDGEIPIDNPDDRNLTRVRLYAGDPRAENLLDDTGRIDVTCREPAEQGTGRIAELFCDEITVYTENVSREEFTLLVQYEDGSNETRVMGTADGGQYGDEVPIRNVDEQNITRVRLYAGNGTDGRLLDDTGRIFVQCRGPEPAPSGAITDVTCENVSVDASDVDAANVTVQVRFSDGSTTNASAAVVDGAFEGEVPFENPDDLNVTRVRLYAGSPDDGALLDDTGRIDVQCREPEPVPTGAIVDVTCENVSVRASNVSAENVTVLVRFADGSTTNGSVPVVDGAFEGEVPFENPDDLNVTRVQLYAGNETTGVLLNDTGRIDVTCNVPFSPTAEFRGDCTEFYVSEHDDLTRVVLNFTDGTNQTFADVPSDREEWTYVGSGANDGKQIANATVYRNGESVRYESDCPTEPDPIPAGSIRDVTCEDVSVLVSNAENENVTILVEFDDGTNTTATAATTDGEFDGDIPFANPDDKNVSRVVLYDGDDTDAPLLTESGPLDVTCREPVREPTGSLGEITCVTDENALSIEVDVSNMPDDQFTIRVSYDGGGGAAAETFDTDSDGNFSGTVEIPLADGQTPDDVRLYPGGGPDDGYSRIDIERDLRVDCTPDPEPVEDLLVVEECDGEQGEVRFINPNDVSVNVTFDGTVYELEANGTSGDSVTIDDLNDGDYGWSAETGDGRSVGSGTATVECDPEPVVCEGEAKYESPEGGWDVESDVGNDFPNATLSGDADAATVTNDEAFAVDVFVKSATGIYGPFTVEAGTDEEITLDQTGDRQLSVIGIVCENEQPDFPPFTNFGGLAGDGTLAVRAPSGATEAVRPTGHVDASTPASVVVV
ncbi:hypothetical protein [Halorubellus salinus]|uniref:hypothetical protein n=1 Tax=Halorubellus salinus TaxID=755309 RepID=UPI001D07EA7A|nr:hypothetical protein [Halorubellus salinus]